MKSLTRKGDGWRFKIQTMLGFIPLLFLGEADYTHSLAPHQSCSVVLFDKCLHFCPDWQVGTHPVYMAPVTGTKCIIKNEEWNQTFKWWKIHPIQASWIELQIKSILITSNFGISELLVNLVPWIQVKQQGIMGDVVSIIEDPQLQLKGSCWFD